MTLIWTLGTAQVLINTVQCHVPCVQTHHSMHYSGDRYMHRLLWPWKVTQISWAPSQAFVEAWTHAHLYVYLARCTCTQTGMPTNLVRWKNAELAIFPSVCVAFVGETTCSSLLHSGCQERGKTAQLIYPLLLVSQVLHSWCTCSQPIQHEYKTLKYKYWNRCNESVSKLERVHSIYA